MNNLSGEIDQNSALVDELKNYLGNTKLYLKFIKEDLQNKDSDLEIIEASFNNEVFILKETIVRQTSEFNSNMDEKETVVMNLVVNIQTLEKKHANSGVYYQKKQAV